MLAAQRRLSVAVVKIGSGVEQSKAEQRAVQCSAVRCCNVRSEIISCVLQRGGEKKALTEAKRCWMKE